MTFSFETNRKSCTDVHKNRTITHNLVVNYLNYTQII